MVEEPKNYVLDRGGGSGAYSSLSLQAALFQFAWKMQFCHRNEVDGKRELLKLMIQLIIYFFVAQFCGASLTHCSSKTQSESP